MTIHTRRVGAAASRLVAARSCFWTLASKIDVRIRFGEFLPFGHPSHARKRGENHSEFLHHRLFCLSSRGTSLMADRIKCAYYRL